MIVGLAGHVDHGKTALVRALTGVDTDALAEEKRRGITIELGFAPLMIDGLGAISLVDVPGHESFVRTMVAGASGIDAALLVVAADEGVMPQTREHIAILDLLGVRHAVVALTKADLVDDAWCAMVAGDVAAALAGTAMYTAPYIAVSSTTGQGLDALRGALAGAARAATARDRTDLSRLPVDRVFSKAGSGTVVTGTLWSGRFTIGDAVLLMPGARPARIRGLQTHGAAVHTAEPGTRVAAALSGVDRSMAARGDTLVGAAAWVPSTTMRADVTLLPAALPLTARSRVRLHIGTREVGARIICAGKAIAGGETRPVRLALDAPVAARGGDRFIVRRPLPAGTIGGGVITDAVPGTSRVKPFATAQMTAEECLCDMIDDAGVRGVDESLLPVRSGLSPARVDQFAGQRSGTRVVRVHGQIVARAAIDETASALMRWLDGYHRSHLHAAGAPLEAARAHCRSNAAVADVVIGQLVQNGAVIVDGPLCRRSTWRQVADHDGVARRDALVARLAHAGPSVPSVAELERELGARVAADLRVLVSEGRVVVLGADRFAVPETAVLLWTRLAEQLSADRAYLVSELRPVLGLSRQYLIPWLEYFDREGRSEREGDARRFRVGTSP
jgi:selenocysteine-specific elongation factor